MAVTLTREFWINFGLFLFTCLALALSIWAFVKPCKKDGFGDTSQQDCSKLKWCDQGGWKDPFCLGDCFFGCGEPPNAQDPEGMLSTGQECKRAECWPNFTGNTDVCQTRCNWYGPDIGVRCD